MKILTRILLIVGIFLTIIILALSIWILTVNDFSYDVTQSYPVSPTTAREFYTDMKLWPEWQDGVKATKILDPGDQSISYEVVRKDDNVTLRDTVVIEFSDSLHLVIKESNMFYQTYKSVNFKQNGESGSAINIHYRYSANTQLQTFFINLIKSELKNQSIKELNNLKLVIEKEIDSN